MCKSSEVNKRDFKYVNIYFDFYLLNILVFRQRQDVHEFDSRVSNTITLKDLDSLFTTLQ